MSKLRGNWTSFVVRFPTGSEEVEIPYPIAEGRLDEAEEKLHDAALGMESFLWEGWPSVEHIRYNMEMWEDLRTQAIDLLGRNQGQMTVPCSAVLALINDLQRLVDPPADETE